MKAQYQTAFFVLLVLICSFNNGYAQKKKQKDEQTLKFIYPEYISQGYTVDGVTQLFKNNEKKGPFFSKGNGVVFDKTCQMIVDVRVDREMHMSSYEYFYKNDTCVTIRIKTESTEKWKDELLKEHEFISEETESNKGRLVLKFKSRDRNYFLKVYQNISDKQLISIQAFFN